MNSWPSYVALTVLCWGLYGVFLHAGALGMGDPIHGRIKAFLFVGVAYFLVAILAPLLYLWTKGASWDLPASGATWSLVAGIVGAIGAFGLLLAYGAGGRPPVVMGLVFGGAPIVTALVNTTKQGLWGEVRWPFVLGLVLVGTGAGLVSRYRPEPPTPALAEPPR
jgi:drug/metabolite transporter (DMT)-like permease